MQDKFASKTITLQKGEDSLSKYHQLEGHLRSFLASSTILITITKNRYTMISVKREPRYYRIRLHEIFLQADISVLAALARYISSNDRNAASMLQDYIDSQKIRQEAILHKRVLIAEGQAQGEIYDLQEIYDELNRRYFENHIRAHIIWGKRVPTGKRQRSIRMGSYSVEERTIRIHPSLDRPFVPRYFVAGIVYHEMLHQKHDIPVVRGRRRFHTKTFLAEEKMFDEYERAKQWERTHLHRLLLY